MPPGNIIFYWAGWRSKFHDFCSSHLRLFERLPNITLAIPRPFHRSTGFRMQSPSRSSLSKLLT